MEPIELRDGEKLMRLRPGPPLSQMGPYEGGSFLVELEALGLRAQRSVFRFGWTDIGGFFNELATAGQGWAGTKSWSSPEHDLSLEATFQSGGHVAIQVVLHDGPMPTWRASLDLEIDAGEDLSTLASDIASAIPAVAS